MTQASKATPSYQLLMVLDLCLQATNSVNQSEKTSIYLFNSDTFRKTLNYRLTSAMTQNYAFLLGITPLFVKITCA